MPEQGSQGDAVLDLEGLDVLVRTLAADHRVVGPVVRDGAIAYDDVTGIDDLPVGWGDEQEPGRYRLRPRDDGAVFGFVVGPDSPRRFLAPPRATLWSATRTDDGFVVDPPPTTDPRPLAFLGLRGCEQAAVAVQDRVLADGPHPDPRYRASRAGAFVVAVGCTDPAATCFCTSFGTGPAPGPGHDLALTELPDPDHHRFVVQVGSPRGEAVLAAVPHRPATDADRAAADAVVADAATRITRHLDPESARDVLAANLEHPQWADVARRCLSCTNCTLVCPTCFCTDVEDVTDLTGRHAQRVERWDSCFTLAHSHLGGGSVRPDVRARYRQWLTHKLSTWWDQFGVSGCVGCGRCITWCPVGIDLTAEVRAIAGTTEGSPSP